MGIWDRLGNVIKSYVNDEREKVFGKTGAKRHNDPDLNAAYEELDEARRHRLLARISPRRRNQGRKPKSKRKPGLSLRKSGRTLPNWA